MVNRSHRNKARIALRKFIDGVITNDEFESEFPSNSEDSAVVTIESNVWLLYSDVRTHRLTGPDEVTEEQRKIVERCILFLATDLEFEWPVSAIRLRNIFATAWGRLSRFIRGPESKLSDGDESIWPFFRTADYEAAKRLGNAD